MWFRQDLRINDNPALVQACQDHDVIPVYILDESVPDYAQLGGASKWCLHHALSDLNRKLDGKLHIAKGDPLEVLVDLAKEVNAAGVYWNRMYEPWAISRDSKLKETLKDIGISAGSCNGSLLWEPMQVLKKDKTPYKVFTPYYRKGCLSKPHPRFPLSAPDLGDNIVSISNNISIDALCLLPSINWDSHINDMWDISEQGAADKLSTFINDSVKDYNDKRNVPSIKGTSQLSPYLHFGLLSPNQAWYAVLDAFDGRTDEKGVDVFLSELGWREFSYYLLYHFPHIQQQNFNPKFDRVTWLNNKDHIQAWQFGNTGVPIVDAGMRELYQTGYMHNRVRMVVGSYLVKNLLTDWRIGERWFWDCLLDADSASNAASWQWVAGSGADAAPYFRVFNPVLQGEKFDKQGEYVKKYCPELEKLPPKYIHQPWAAPTNILEYAGITLGKTYPKPLVDLKASRERALDAFKAMKEGNN